MTDYKPHPASRRKQRRARRDGKVLKSQLVTQIAGFFLLAFIAFLALRLLWVRILMLLHYSWSAGIQFPFVTSRIWLDYTLLGLLGVALLLALGAVAMEAIQVGFECFPGLCLPKLSRLNPVLGLQRIGRALKQSWLFGFLTFCFLGFLSASLLFVIGCLPAVLSREAYPALVCCLLIVWFFFLASIVFFSGLSFIDYAVKRRDYFRELSMSVDEMRREQKEDTGDPLHKSRRQAFFSSWNEEDLKNYVRSARVIVVKRRSA